MKLRISTVAALAVSILVARYSISSDGHHMVYPGLFLVAVVLAGFWLGLRAALATSLGISIGLVPFAIMHWREPIGYDCLIEILLYNTIAIVIGVQHDREARRRERRREAEHLEALGKSVSCLAHDIKTSLVAIGGFTRWAKKHIDFDSPSHEKLDIVLKETRRLENMVKDMLDFSRPLQLQCSDERPDTLIHESLTLVDPIAHEKRVGLHSRFSGEIAPVPLDGMRIKQVIINLLMNAVEASPELGAVTVSCSQGPGGLVIDVEDQGSGIAESNMELIFNPFFTTRKEGTGLGLPIVKKIVEAHGGSIEIVQNGGSGVTFRSLIPFKERIAI